MQHTNTSSTSGGSTTSLFVSRSGRAMAPHDKEQRQSNKNRLTLSKTPILGLWRPAWILSYEEWDGNVAAFGPRARLDVHAVSREPPSRPGLKCATARGPAGARLSLLPVRAPGAIGLDSAVCLCAPRRSGVLARLAAPRWPAQAGADRHRPCGHGAMRHRRRCCSLFSPRFRAGRRACSPALLQLTCARLAR